MFDEEIKALIDRLRFFESTLANIKESNEPEYIAKEILSLARQGEALAIQSRGLVHCTGSLSLINEVEEVARKDFGAKAYISDKGHISLEMPMLLPKKRSGSNTYLNSHLEGVLSDFKRDLDIGRYETPVILVFDHISSKDKPWRRARDVDNIEVKFVADLMTMYFLLDDNPVFCSHFYRGSIGDEEKTIVTIVPEDEFVDFLEGGDKDV